jgi:hypothetical protein
VKYEKVAKLLELLSPPSFRLLAERAARINRPWARSTPVRHPVVAIGRNGERLQRKLASPFNVILPTPDDLRDPATRDQACSTIRMLCSLGDRELYAPLIIYEERPSGVGGGLLDDQHVASDAGGREQGSGCVGQAVPTDSCETKRLPPIRKRRPKRRAELELVGMLRNAWLVATETIPARTASWHQPGPFVRFVTKCLQLVRAYSVPGPGEPDRAAMAAARLIHAWERCRRPFENG